MQCHDVRQEQILPLCVLALDFTGSPVPSWACITRMSSDFTGFPVLSEEPSSLCKRLSSISCERDVFPFSTKTRSVTSGFPDRSQIGLGLDWVGLGQRCLLNFSTRLLSEFSNWLLFNCRTQVIIPFGPIVIVFQWDLWWWSRRQVWSFIQNFSSFQSFNFWNAIS